MAPNFDERVKRVDPERFRFALGVYCAAAALKGPSPNPQEFGLDIEDDDGSVIRLSFTDRAENRGMLAVKKEFPDPAEFQAMGVRLMTLGEIMNDRRLRRWGLVRDGETSQIEIHPAVSSALATAPFRRSGTLDRTAFLVLVKNEQRKMETEEFATER